MARHSPGIVRPLGSGFKLPDTVDPKGRLTLRNAPSIPFISYPDGTPCLFGNLFMLHLYDQNYSITDDGGSLEEYANQISLIIRYTYDNRISLLNMTESRIKNFRNWMRGRKFKGKSPGTHRVNTVLSTTLDFLYHAGVQTGYPEYISPTGAVKAERIVKSSIRRASGTLVQIFGWKHSCFLVDDGLARTGQPIGADTLEELWLQVDQIPSDFIRRRTEVLIGLLEHIGGRRAEIGNVLVSSIIAALRTEDLEPYITIQSRKGQRNATREVPVPRYVLEDALEFINTERRTLLHQRGIKPRTEDMLFISARTGRPIAVKHITYTFHQLKKAAGINGKAHPHQMRHLYISKRFEERVMSAISASSSPLLSLDSIIQKTVAEIKQFSGHTSDSGLNTYVKSVKEKVLNKILKMAELPHHTNSKTTNAVDALIEELSQVQPNDLEKFIKNKLKEMQENND
ncbi:tyrosine-type recombinase/integrase [Pseudomonas sp. MWU12-2345]|uniref:tyrosine-type recombinase/integrase n=1 Tax=Pseudomonas sp. MWU12-2345 TaxID=2928689 RepID=UPI00200F2C9F|nr:tyrosine-type recombinase/integrase [Pseudomonas sp. MWU12-2345]